MTVRGVRSRYAWYFRAWLLPAYAITITEVSPIEPNDKRDVADFVVLVDDACALEVPLRRSGLTFASNFPVGETRPNVSTGKIEDKYNSYPNSLATPLRRLSNTDADPSLSRGTG